MKNRTSFLKDRYDPINNRTITYDEDSRLRAVLSLIEPSAKKINVLDIGCYDGEISKRIKEKVGNCVVYGIDVSDNTKEEAEKKGVVFKSNDLNEGIDFPDNMFDLVFAGEIIEHIYDTDFLVDEIRRILKPEGVLVITTPNLLSFGRRVSYLIGKGVFMEASLTYPKKPQPAGHVRFFTKDLLLGFMNSKGFKVEKYLSDTVNFIGFRSDFLAKVFPTFGRSIICRFRNVK